MSDLICYLIEIFFRTLAPGAKEICELIEGNTSIDYSVFIFLSLIPIFETIFGFIQFSRDRKNPCSKTY